MAKSTKIATKTTKGSALMDLASIGEQILNNNSEDEFAPFARINGTNGEIISGDHDFTDDPKALNIHSIIKGHAAWHKKLGQAPAEKEYRYLTQNPEEIDTADLPDIPSDCSWGAYINMVLKDVDTGQEFNFSCGNMSSVNAAKSLINQVFTPSHGEDLNTRIPMVQVSVDSFVAKKTGNEIFKPVFKVVDWVDAEEGMFASPIGENTI